MRRLGPLRWYPGAQVRLALVTVGSAAAGAGLAHLVGGALGLLAGTAGGGLLLAGAVVLLRALPEEDAAWLGDLVGGRGGPVVRASVRRLVGAP